MYLYNQNITIDKRSLITRKINSKHSKSKPDQTPSEYIKYSSRNLKYLQKTNKVSNKNG